MEAKDWKDAIRKAGRPMIEYLLRCGLGLTVLKEGITFGSQEHDPIKYIFTLSAVDNESHLTTMSQLLELFNEPSFFTMMDEAETPQEVIAYIKSHITMNGL